MKPSIRKEIPLLILVAIPFVYLAYVWNELPSEVPLHWNLKGEVDRYGSKQELLFIPILLPLLSYLLFLIIPLIDPKKKIQAMGKKYNNLKIILVAFTSLLSLYIIYSTKSNALTHPNVVLVGIGALYLLLGNYFKTIKPNYFIGIRTPWTLESELVWKKTHQMAGKLWFVGGLLVMITSLLLEEEINFFVFMSITAIISIIPLLYSYLEYKKIPS